MAAIRSAAISAAAIVAPRGFGRRRRLVPCLAAPARGASGVTVSASGKMPPRSALYASASPASTTGAPDSDEAAEESLVEAELSKLACPICYYPLFEMAKDYLKPKGGGIIIDASCGSGLFSRLFVKSELYFLVVALDFSENMLKQCKEFIKQENISDEQLVLVRADISRLPFVNGSIDALHAGAAIHCWPSPACAIAEISRVLRPGGIFVGSTFIADVLPPVIPLLRIGRPYVDQITGNNTFLSELELEDLCRACGLVNFTFVRNGFYIMFSATKAS